jgi:hypothetical protein
MLQIVPARGWSRYNVERQRPAVADSPAKTGANRRAHQDAIAISPAPTTILRFIRVLSAAGCGAA